MAQKLSETDVLETAEDELSLEAMLGLDDTLMGTFYLTMDAKGRMSFPSKLREVIGDRFIVTKGLDGCLYVYSCTEFREMTRRLKTKPMAEARLFSRSFVGYATVAETDKNGRILIPQALRECAGLSKDVVVVGVIDRCEIWSKEKWELYNSDNEDRLAATLEGLQL